MSCWSQVLGVWNQERVNPKFNWMVSLSRELVVQAVEEVFLVALVVQHLEFGRIEESAGVQPAEGDEVAPLLASVSDVRVERRRAEAAVRGGHFAVWVSCLPRPERVVTLTTTLVLPPYSAGGAPSITSMD